MKKLYRGLALLILSMFVATGMHAQIIRPIGTNITGIVDYSSEYVFVDVFRQSRQWIAHDSTPGAPWNSGVDIPLRADGYPVEIPYNDGVHPPQHIRALMFFGELEGLYPSGKYHLIASGQGNIVLWGAASGSFQCPVDTYVDVDSERGGIALEITRSEKNDPVRDIHFIMPGFDQSYQTNPFYPPLLDFLKDFQVIRFMDWMNTNNSPVVEWKDRNKIDSYTQTSPYGVAYEYIIDLCNRSGKDAWICIPHKASDNYIVELARFFKNELDPKLKLYVEYSNEVWNGAFEQNGYATQKGEDLGYSGQPWEIAWQYYAKRSADVHRIFEEVFGDTRRLVKVVASQAAVPWISNYIMERYSEPKYNSYGVKADALAIAPYFAGDIGRKIGDAGLANTITIDAILDSMEHALGESYTWMQDSKTVANDFKLDLIAYEGGQHLIAGWEYNNNEAFVNKLLDANRHPRMEDLYCQYFNYWYEEAKGGLFANFSSHGNYSKWGSWGVKETYEDTLAPKYLGLKNCVFLFNKDTTTAAQIPDLSPVDISPNPSGTGEVTIYHRFKDPSVHLYDNLGRPVRHSRTTKGDFITIQVGAYRGTATLLLEDGINIYCRKLLFF